MSNIIIIGSGPAGVSASLYTVRAGIETKIISKGEGALEKAEKIENYYGFSRPLSGHELSKSAIDGAKQLGVDFVDSEVVGIGFEDKFIIKTTGEQFTADSVILATGSARLAPKINGIKEFEGRGISYCAACDAFFYRNKKAAVLGSGEYAVHEAKELLPVASSVVMLTNGSEPSAEIPDGLEVNRKKISEVFGSDKVNGIRFDDESSIDVDGIFISVGVAGSTALARKIGAVIDGNSIVTDENMATNINGLFAAGDCTGGMLQISKAVSDGAKAGSESIKYLRSL